MAEILEPPLHLDTKRRTFHTPCLPQFQGVKLRAVNQRLRDLVLAVAQSDDPDYFDDPEPGVFAVVDVVTKEKGFCVMPFGATPDNLEAIIAGHFNAPAFRVGEKLWFV